MMDIARKIELPASLKTDALRRLMAVLDNGDKEPHALLVGGCVRNVLVGRAVDDIDIATLHTPQQVITRMTEADIKAVPTGIDHGTVTVVIDGQGFEVTTLRRDVETDGRHAVVSFTDDWCEDAQRRDFTMNTLLCDLSGHVYDPTGRGLSDLDAGRVVFVGAPAQRIAEDYLRVLRFFRFYGTYGKGAPDKKALMACKNAAEHVLGLSRERITQEFLKIISMDKAVDVLSLMHKNNVLALLFGERYQAGMLAALILMQERYNARNVIARLVVLSGVQRDYETVRDTYLLLSKKQKKEFTQMINSLDEQTDFSEKNTKIIVYRHGRAFAVQFVLLLRARMREMSHFDDDLDAAVDLARNWSAPDFPLTGHDVKNIGVSDGPLTGEMLSRVEQWWMDQGFTPSRLDCLQKLESFLR